jgi:hypothetical protein
MEKIQDAFVIEQFVFLDAVSAGCNSAVAIWAKTNRTPTHGRVKIGQRVLDFVPHGHGKTTCLSALQHDGLTAPRVVDGAINGQLFLAWVKQAVLPTLREGDIVVRDNWSSHNVSGVKEAMKSVGAKALYLPPYSPDFNPMERVFAKRKGRDGCAR